MGKASVLCDSPLMMTMDGYLTQCLPRSLSFESLWLIQLSQRRRGSQGGAAALCEPP